MICGLSAAVELVGLEPAEFGTDGELRIQFVDGIRGDEEVTGSPIAARDADKN